MYSHGTCVPRVVVYGVSHVARAFLLLHGRFHPDHVHDLGYGHIKVGHRSVQEFRGFLRDKGKDLLNNLEFGTGLLLPLVLVEVTLQIPGTLSERKVKLVGDLFKVSDRFLSFGCERDLGGCYMYEDDGRSERDALASPLF